MIEGNKAEAQKRLEFGENLPPKRGRANENWSGRPVWSSNEGSLTRESVREALSKCARASSIQEGCCEVPTRRADQRPVPTEPKVSAELIGRRSKEAATPYNAKRASSAASLLLSLSRTASSFFALL